MKKKMIVSAIVMFSLTAAAITYAMSAQQQTAVWEMYEQTDEMNYNALVETEQEQTPSLQENPVLAAVQAQGLQAYQVDDTFTELITDYYMTNEEQQYLAGLMSQGYEAKWLAEIFEFYITCCEDKEVIQEIYDIAIEKGYADKFWVEEAYNDATDDVHGVLDSEEMNEYLYVDGIEIEDVKAANVLSRRGVYTIQQLLTKRQEGKSWSTLIDEVYQSDLPDNITPMAAAIEARKQSSQNIVLSVANQQPVFSTPENGEALEAAAQSNEAAVSQALEQYFDEQTLQYYLNRGVDEFLLYNAYFVAQDEGISVDTVLYQYQRAGKYARLLERMVVLP